MRTYSEEEKDFLEKHDYIEDRVQGHMLRYVLGGSEGSKTLVFMQGLDIQQMFMRYVEVLEDSYRVLLIEYPTDTKTIDEQLAVIHGLLEKLDIKYPVIIGASDGGMFAQLYARRYKDVSALVLMATVTLDSEYLEPDRKRPWFTGVLTGALRILPWKLSGRILTGKVNTYYEGETEEEMAYGASFFKMIADDRRSKSKMIHSFSLVGKLIHEPLLKTSDLECVRGRILLLLPEHDIFSKKDQKTLEELMPDPEVHYLRGSHHGPWVLQDDYISIIKDFLPRLRER
ncbi:MAG: alpha/beta hydrolase [Clostridiales bacterium]|nr:alpha/beta hydrolase [Clostridiales bacterium]